MAGIDENLPNYGNDYATDPSWTAIKGNVKPKTKSKSKGSKTNSNPNAVYDANWNYLWSSDIVYWWQTQKQVQQANLKNADMNLNQYWDDSSAANYNDPNLWWWKNDKYTWETTKNTFTSYDPNITLDQLEPNYQFGWNAQLANSEQANYIANRNDQIASALYNAWKTSIEDVRAYLEGQQSFWDSNPNERENTINSIWKRIWEIKPQEEPKETPGFPEEKEQTWKIYGRELGTDSNGWDFAFGEETLADPYSIEAKMYASRKNNYEALQSLDSYDIAVLVSDGTTPYGEQAMYDLQRYDPVKYKEIQDYVKEIKAEDYINNLTHWSANLGSNIVDVTDTTIENDIKSWVDQNSDERTADQINTSLSDKIDNNLTIGSAKAQMIKYKEQIVDLQAELEDLPNQAKKAFKGDVPDYFYKAYISNNSQRIQHDIEKLESKYTWLADIYKTELAQAQREAEMELKYKQLSATETQNKFDQWYKMAQLEQNSVQWAKDSNGNMYAYKIINWQVVKVTDGTAYQWYLTNVDSTVTQANQMVWQYFGQCEVFTDSMSNKTAWVTMVWFDWTSATTAAEKAWYATQFEAFSDYIPEVWDIAVFTNNWSNWIDEKWWHTMYVTWYDSETWLITMVWSNYMGDEKVYSKQYTLEEFYNKGWQWFRNPYKYAQRSAALESQSTYNWSYSPMQPMFDKLVEWYRDAWKMSMMEWVAKLQEAYTILRKDVENGNIMNLIEEWDIWKFLNNVALFRQNQDLGSTTGWWQKTSAGSALSNFLKLGAEEAMGRATRYAAQNQGDAEAYKAFQDIMRVIEIKLRDESGAAINQWEWWTDFMLYMPQAWDSKEVIKWDMERMEEYIRRMAMAAWITSKEYQPLFTDLWKRDID